MDNLIQLEIIGRRTFKSHDIQETYHSNILVACPWDPRTLIYLFYLYFTVLTVDFTGCVISLLFEYSFYICYSPQLPLSVHRIDFIFIISHYFSSLLLSLFFFPSLSTLSTELLLSRYYLSNLYSAEVSSV